MGDFKMLVVDRDNSDLRYVTTGVYSQLIPHFCYINLVEIAWVYQIITLVRLFNPREYYCD